MMLTNGQELANGDDMSKYRLPLNSGHQSALAKAATEDKRSQIKQLEHILDEYFRMRENPNHISRERLDYEAKMGRRTEP